MNKEAEEWKELALKFKEMLEQEMRSHRKTRSELTKTYNRLLDFEIEELNKMEPFKKAE